MPVECQSLFDTAHAMSHHAKMKKGLKLENNVIIEDKKNDFVSVLALACVGWHRPARASTLGVKSLIFISQFYEK